jgi:hypothetical protein
MKRRREDGVGSGSVSDRNLHLTVRWSSRCTCAFAALAVNRTAVTSPSQRVQALQSELATHWNLPIAPVEFAFIVLIPSSVEVGSIVTPLFPCGNELSIGCLTQAVRPGSTAKFIVYAPGTPLGRKSQLALASALCFKATLRGREDSPAASGGWPSRPLVAPSTQLLAVSYEPSVTHGGVLVTVPVPDSASDGSRVSIYHASVAGIVVPHDSSKLQVAVGYEHRLSWAGPVWAAASAGDVPAILSALKCGASTEEADEVSCDNQSLIVMG